MEITKDFENKKMFITREFKAPVEKVWKAWTQADLLDKWWAPKPWRAETKSMSFEEGGSWIYCMIGPENEKHWARVDFKKIQEIKSFEAMDYFSDENGNKNSELPTMTFFNSFNSSEKGTKVDIILSFIEQKDMEEIIKMGFQEGFSSALNNLDELLDLT